MTLEPLTPGYLGSLARMAGTVKDSVDLGMGGSRSQGLFGTCAAHAILNVVEGCRRKPGADPKLWPDIPAIRVYDLAKRKYDNLPDYQAGTDLVSAGQAYAELAGTGVRVMDIPINLVTGGKMSIEEFITLWLAVEQTPLAIGMTWTTNDQFPGSSRVLEPSKAYVGGHAVSVHGYKKSHSWTRFRLFGIPLGKRRSAPVFLVENSNNTHPELPLFLPMKRLQTDLISVVTLLPP